jgi:predicted Zn-dependent protease
MAEAKSDIQGSVVPTTKTQAVLMLESAYLWMDMGKFDHAKDVLTGAAALMPKSEVPQLALGTLEFNQGHLEKALQAFRVAQRLSPKSSLVRAHCGEVLLFMGKVNEAMKELKSALDLEPDSDGAKFAQSLLEAKEAGALPPPKATKASKK